MDAALLAAASRGQTHAVEALLTRAPPDALRASATSALAAARGADRRDTAEYLSDILAADDFEGGGGAAAGARAPPADEPTAVLFRVADPEIDPDAYGGVNRPAAPFALANPPSMLEGADEVVFPDLFRFSLAGPKLLGPAAHASETRLAGGTRAAGLQAIASYARAALDLPLAEVAVSRADPAGDGTWRVWVSADPGVAGGVDDEGDAAAASPPFPFKRRFLPDAAAVYFARLRANDYSRVERTAYARGHRGRKYPPARRLRWQYGCGRRQTQTAIVINERAYDEVDVVTDLFTEDARMAAAVEGKPSPLAVWADPAKRAEVIQNARALAPRPLAEGMSGEALALYAQREAIWHATPEATSFKVSLAKAIYEFFGARRTLDPCAGWGDRMVGAAAAGLERYVGLDPNPALVKGHRAIAEFVAAETKGGAAAGVRPIPAEDYTAEMAAEDFGGRPPDLVFTSPPFFTYEDYNPADEAQSIARHPTLDGWVNGWLLPVMGQTWEHLAPDGHFAIYIADAGGHNVVTPLVEYMSKLGRFCGVVACRRGKKRPVPLFVWRKAR